MPKITHYSVEFLRLLHISSSATGTPILADDPDIAAGCVALGLSPSWLADRLSSTDETSGPVDLPGDLKVTEKPLHDTAGYISGRLLFFSVRATFGSIQSVLKRARDAKRDLSVLSSREAEILELVFSGLTNKAVARRASISEKTVEKHRANIMRKLQVRTSAHLIRRATEASLIADE